MIGGNSNVMMSIALPLSITCFPLREILTATQNGYARLLEDVAEPTICDSITLLEGVPFEKELAQLDSKYRTAKFEGLFRTKKINVYPPISKHSVPLQTLGSPSPQTSTRFLHPNGCAPLSLTMSNFLA